MSQALTIPLTQGKVAIVDSEDYERLNQHKWHANKSRHSCYAIRTIKCDGRKSNLCMHREIMHATKGIDISHINRNCLDNRKANLRICTNQQSQFAQSPTRNKTSVFKGVFWHRHHGKWQSQIVCNYRQYHLGYFEDEIEAARAYDQAAIRLFGEFAFLNFPSKESVSKQVR